MAVAAAISSKLIFLKDEESYIVKEPFYITSLTKSIEFDTTIFGSEYVSN